MASLKSLLSTKSIVTEGTSETNIEKGRVWGFTPMNHSEVNNGGMKFFGCQIITNDTDVVNIEVEMWGAGGRGGSCHCCCAAGPGGNTGSYVSFTIPMTRTGYICITGMRACNSGSHCQCGGQGSSTCAEICPGSVAACTYACMCACAQAGLGGRQMCIDGGQSMYTCLKNMGACYTDSLDLDGNAVGAGCGIICNYGTGTWPNDSNLPQSYVSTASSSMSKITCCPSLASSAAKMYFGHCNLCCWNCHRQVISTAPMRYSTCGGEMQLNHGWNDYMSYEGSAFGQMDAAVQGLSRAPTSGTRSTRCWAGDKTCTCYETQGCWSPWPVAQPSPATFACSGVRAHGWAGGHGAVRIKYLGNPSSYTSAGEG